MHWFVTGLIWPVCGPRCPPLPDARHATLGTTVTIETRKPALALSEDPKAMRKTADDRYLGENSWKGQGHNNHPVAFIDPQDIPRLCLFHPKTILSVVLEKSRSPILSDESCEHLALHSDHLGMHVLCSYGFDCCIWTLPQSFCHPTGAVFRQSTACVVLKGQIPLLHHMRYKRAH